MRKGAAELAEKQSEVAGMRNDLEAAQQALAACREEAQQLQVSSLCQVPRFGPTAQKHGQRMSCLQQRPFSDDSWSTEC